MTILHRKLTLLAEKWFIFQLAEKQKRGDQSNCLVLPDDKSAPGLYNTPNNSKKRKTLLNTKTNVKGKMLQKAKAKHIRSAADH